MNKTALTDVHIALGAKMVPFAGYQMPVSYAGIREEHLAVRNGVGVFDVSHMGEFILKGERALELIQHLTSNDASRLVDGKVQYTCMPNYNGGIVDDLLVYRLSETAYMLVVNASNITKDWDWIVKHNKFDVHLEDISDKTTLLALQGPMAGKVVGSLSDMDLNGLSYYSFTKGEFAGIGNVLVSATGYTGSGGFEIYCKNDFAGQIWEALFNAGKDLGIKPIGLGARDTLRLEMGFCLYGNDIDDSTSPIEAGLGWITKFSKEFVNSKELQNQKEQGVVKKLVGFELLERGIPRKGYPILDDQKNIIGNVTSGTMSPSLDKAIGMGYVSREFAIPNTPICIEIRSKPVLARVQKLPFYSIN